MVERLPAITYIAELGSEGPWHYVSPQIESILGFSPAEWLSDPAIWMSRIHKDDRGIALAAEKRSKKLTRCSRLSTGCWLVTVGSYVSVTRPSC